ncbi:hypothetical protein LZ30DRAFT_691022 [Colletotrichum cereale]|nr:hypothetical protein LZ30DRAFT_691022 [Colletotrichum cereale]
MTDTQVRAIYRKQQSTSYIHRDKLIRLPQESKMSLSNTGRIFFVKQTPEKRRKSPVFDPVSQLRQSSHPNMCFEQRHGKVYESLGSELQGWPLHFIRISLLGEFDHGLRRYQQFLAVCTYSAPAPPEAEKAAGAGPNDLSREAEPCISQWPTLKYQTRDTTLQPNFDDYKALA